MDATRLGDIFDGAAGEATFDAISILVFISKAFLFSCAKFLVWSRATVPPLFYGSEKAALLTGAHGRVCMTVHQVLTQRISFVTSE